MADALAGAAAGSGFTLPVARYETTVNEMFPRVDRSRPVEETIEAKFVDVVLPSNASASSMGTEQYVEFRVASSSGYLIDMSNIMLEVVGHSVGGDGKAIAADKRNKLVPSNALLHSMFKGASVYFNGKQVEHQPLYHYKSYVNLLTHSSSKMYDTLLSGMGMYRETIVPSGGSNDYFSVVRQSDPETVKRVDRTCDGLHMMGPLMLDVSSLDAFVLDDVDIVIRLEFNSSAVQFLTEEGSNLRPSLSFTYLALHVPKYKPFPSALMGLNHILEESPLVYTYTQTRYRTYVIGSGQSQMPINDPFNSDIPRRIYMVLVEGPNFSGSYMRNALHFSHNNLSRLSVTVNNRSIYNVRCSFPDGAVCLYTKTLEALGLTSDHLLDRNSFENGKTVIVLDLDAQQLENVLPRDESGNLRIELEFSTPNAGNVICLLFAESAGILRMNSDRDVSTEVR